MTLNISKLLVRYAIADNNMHRCCFLRIFSAQKSTVAQDEINKFNELAVNTDWWGDTGATKILRDLNKIRVPLTRDGLLSMRGIKSQHLESDLQPLKGFKILDVGCGAGFYSEALASIGADVTGIDASANLITVAKDHASQNKTLPSVPNYINTTIEDHAKESVEKYDALVCSEVMEHVENKPFFVEQSVKCVKRGGSLFYTTINQTWAAGFVIFLIENVIRMAPKGTHPYHLLVPHRDLQKYLVQNGCELKLIQGICLTPKLNWIYINSVKLHYAMHAVKK